jgi:hypothetical protein
MICFLLVNKVFASENDQPCNPCGSQINTTSCDSYTWNGNTFTLSGIYTFTYIDAGGCSCIDTLNLTINNSQDSIVLIDTCKPPYTWPINGQTYTNTGMYTSTMLNPGGCVINFYLYLNFKPLAFSILVEPADSSIPCSNMKKISFINYTNDNCVAAYRTCWPPVNDLLTPYALINLAVDSPNHVFELRDTCKNCIIYKDSMDVAKEDMESTRLDVIQSCGSYTWPEDGNTYTASGVYTHSVVDTSGCFIISTLKLTVSALSTYTLNATFCGNYTWIANGVTYNSAGVYYDTVGCSVYILNLSNNANCTISNPVPTLSQWMLIFLVLITMSLGAIIIYKNGVGT